MLRGERTYPNRELRVVVDNLNIHKNDAARRWLGRHPQVPFHYTPTHASWVNLIECFLSILSKQGLAHSVQHSKQDLKELLHRFLANYNRTCIRSHGPKVPSTYNASSKPPKTIRSFIPCKRRRPPAKRGKADSVKN
jgi:transposase